MIYFKIKLIVVFEKKNSNKVHVYKFNFNLV